MSRCASVHCIVLHYLPHYCGLQPTLGVDFVFICPQHQSRSSPSHLLSPQSSHLQPMEGIEWQIGGLSSKLFTCMFLSRFSLNFLPHIDREWEREREGTEQTENCNMILSCLDIYSSTGTTVVPPNYSTNSYYWWKYAQKLLSWCLSLCSVNVQRSISNP